jgi:uncharacterized protein YggE
MLKAFALLTLLAVLPLTARAQTVPPPRPVSGITVVGHGEVPMPVRQVALIAAVRGVEQTVVSSNTPATVRGVVRNLSAARLEQVRKAANEFVRGHPGVQIDSLRFIPALTGCEPFEARARRIALAEAHRKAAAVASAAGAVLGSVRAVSESGGCPVLTELRSAYGGWPEWFNLGALSATIGVYETTTYTLTGGRSASR